LHPAADSYSRWVKAPRRSTLVPATLAALLLAATSANALAQTPQLPPPSTSIYPLAQVHRGQHATAWTVFAGRDPEPMDVEIIGVLRGSRGPGHDMILSVLRGAKPEYTGVVAGMSGSPVYIDGKLVGALAYRIGQFSKEPIAGITPIEQMLEVRDLPENKPDASTHANLPAQSGGISGAAAQDLRPMETPLVMAGFRPEAIALWKKQMAGSGLDEVSAGGMGSGSAVLSTPEKEHILPGSAVSMQLVRGDVEVAATCTVTYIDPKQLLACGHPVLQAGAISVPLTATEVVATLPSPMNAFKIVNTGALVGSIDQDRDAAIRGIFGKRANMIPVEIALKGVKTPKTLHIEVLDLASMTPQAVAVAIFNALLQSVEASPDNSYHVKGSIDVAGMAPVAMDLWAPAGDQIPAAMGAALLAGDKISRVYSNPERLQALTGIHVEVEKIDHRVDVELVGARIVSGDIVRPGATVTVEATLRGWQQPIQNLRIPVKLPTRLHSGDLRLLVSDAGTLDRTLDQPRQSGHATGMATVVNTAKRQHPADRLYVSILVPESQASMDGATLPGLPLSLANTLEGMRNSQDASLNGESAELEADSPAGGVLTGFQLLNLRIEGGGGLD